MPQTKTYEVYTFDELPEESKQKALQLLRDQNEYFFLESEIKNKLMELLEENKWQILPSYSHTWKPDSSDIKVLYSLSYSQGDGAMFEGSFIIPDYPLVTFHVKHSGHYYHERSTSIESKITETDETPDNYKELETAFEMQYIYIAKQLAQFGYDCIEYDDSDEALKETIEANEYLFTLDGRID